MANKSVTITEPVVNDVIHVLIRCDGAGNISALAGDVKVASDDGSTSHSGNFTYDVSSLPAAVQTAVDNLLAECISEFISEHGF